MRAVLSICTGRKLSFASQTVDKPSSASSTACPAAIKASRQAVSSHLRASRPSENVLFLQTDVKKVGYKKEKMVNLIEWYRGKGVRERGKGSSRASDRKRSP